MIEPTKRRIGQLDRKLRIINENAEDYAEWTRWAIRVFEVSYGYGMMSDHKIKSMVDFPNAKEVFPNTSISGGVNYFVWKKNYQGQCDFTSVLNGNSDTMTRNLDEFPVLVISEPAFFVEKFKLFRLVMKPFKARSGNIAYKHPNHYAVSLNELYVSDS